MTGGTLKCVLVAVDGSEESMKALNWALDNLKLHSPQLQLPISINSSSVEQQQQQLQEEDDEEEGHFLILHVQSPPSIASGLNPGVIPFGGPDDVEVPAFAKAIEAHQRRISEAIMTHALQICSEKKVKVKTQVIVGDPKDVICEVVDDQKVDLLVMGCRSIGPIKRMFLGSVSNYLTHNAQCPVVVVKNSS